MNQETKNQLQDGIWKIERYGTHDGINWNEVKSKTNNAYLILKNLNLIIIHNDTLIEHISFLNTNIRMLLKNDSLGIAIIHEGMKMRKIRVKFAGTNIHSSTVIAKNCAEVLKKYVKVEDLSTINLSGNTTSSCDNVCISLSQYISELLNKNITEFYLDNKELASLYPLEDIVEVCILDNEFPNFVAEVHNLLKKKIN